MSSPNSYRIHTNLPSFQVALTRISSLFPLTIITAANGKKALRNLCLIAFVILCAAGSAHAQTCSAMSLGNGASLNGFVPFPSTNAWNTNIASLTPDPNSAAIVAAAGFTGLSTHVNFGSSVQDGGIPYVIVDSTQTPAVSINVIDYANQSDVVLAPFPPNAPMEGDLPDCSGWPDTYNGDAHVLVLDRAKCVLYETWNTNRCNGQYNSSSETTWDLKNSESRPWGWTSADAAGLPVFPGLVRYDEVASGAINHAIRFTLQHTKNDGNGGYFVEPASHAAGTDWGVSNIIGMKIRLKASFDISGYSPANQVILTALKQYGMILADNGGNFYIQGATDPRWDDADLANLAGIPSSEFDVMPMTPEFPGYDSATAPTGGLPVINSFTVTASSVNSGSPVTFDYNVSGDSYDYIDMIGPVTAGTGSVTINPTATQTYTLYSTNAFGQTVSTPVLVSVPGSVVAAPVLTPPGGAYPVAQTVTINTATYPYAAIYYTTDGSTPTYPITGTTHAYPVTPTPPNSQGNVNSITVASSQTVKAIAVVPGYSSPSAAGSATYTIGVTQAATPAFNPPGATYTAAQSVAISTTTTTGSPVIYYTTDGSNPATSSSAIKYTGPVAIAATETLNAVAEATGFSNSAEGSASYTINLPVAATPAFNVAAGTYTAIQTVTISTTTTAGNPVIYYTTDGSNPATSTTAIKYTAPVTVSATETLNAVAEATGFETSAEGTAAYTINVPFAGPQYVQSCIQTASYAKSVTCTLNGVGAGHTLVIAVIGGGVVQSATVTSSSGTPTLVVQDGYTLSAYLLPNTTAGTINITAAISAYQTYWLSVYEYANTAVSPLDGAAFTLATNWTPTSVSSPSLTTTAASDTLWSYCVAPGGYVFTPGSAPIPWTALPAQTAGYENFAEDGPTAAAGAYYGQCDTGSGVAIPEIITLALKPPPPLFGNLDSALDSVTKTTPIGQSDSVVVRGWVADLIDGAPLSNVKVYIDGNLVGTPTLGIARSDVAAVEGAAYLNSGYQLSYSAANLALGSHSVTVVAIDSAAHSKTFGPLTFTVAVTAGVPPAPLFGNLDSALDSVTKTTPIGQSDSVVVRGWAADLIDGAPLSNVKVYIDGNLAGSPTLGIARPDVAAVDGAPYLNSGYQLSYSAAALALGSHSVTVVAIDSTAHSKTFGPLTFTVAATAGIPPAPLFGNLDSALDSVTKSTTVQHSDSVVVRGWAADLIDGAPLSNVKVYIDGNLAGTPTLGLARPDVAAVDGVAYLNSGYQLSYSAAALALGSHSVTVVAVDSTAHSKTLGPLTFTVQ